MYWKKIFTLKNRANTAFKKKIKIVFELLLVLPFSNVSVEKISATIYFVSNQMIEVN